MSGGARARRARAPGGRPPSRPARPSPPRGRRAGAVAAEQLRPRSAQPVTVDTSRSGSGRRPRRRPRSWCPSRPPAPPCPPTSRARPRSRRQHQRHVGLARRRSHRGQVGQRGGQRLPADVGRGVGGEREVHALDDGVDRRHRQGAGAYRRGRRSRRRSPSSPRSIRSSSAWIGRLPAFLSRTAASGAAVSLARVRPSIRSPATPGSASGAETQGSLGRSRLSRHPGCPPPSPPCGISGVGVGATSSGGCWTSGASWGGVS